MRVVITGGAGFIGHHLALFMKNLGHDVAVYDSLERASEYGVKRIREAGIKLVKGDIGDKNRIKWAFREIGADGLVHAAAYIDVVESTKKPELYLENNTVKSYTVFEAAAEGGVEYGVYISSAAVYGEPRYIPIDEKHPTEPLSPYGLSKLMGEYVARFVSKIYGMPTAIMRLFNVYGPGQTGAYAGVISKFIERVVRGEPPIIFGDGEQTRDFIHILDVCRAINLALEAKAEGVFNVATGKSVSIKKLAEIIIKEAGVSLSPVYMSKRPGDIKHSLADISKIKTVLGFTPQIDVKDGIKELVKEALSKKSSVS